MILNQVTVNPGLNDLSDLSILFLMFLMGLSIDFEKVMGENVYKASTISVIGGFLTFFTAMSITALLGFDLNASILVGIAFISTSTAIGFMVLLEIGDNRSKVFKTIMSVGTTDDILAMLMLSLFLSYLSTRSRPEKSGHPVPGRARLYHFSPLARPCHLGEAHQHGEKLDERDVRYHHLADHHVPRGFHRSADRRKSSHGRFPRGYYPCSVPGLVQVHHAEDRGGQRRPFHTSVFRLYGRPHQHPGHDQLSAFKSLHREDTRSTSYYSWACCWS